MIDGVVFIHDPHLAGQRHLLIVAHQAVPQQVAQGRDQRLGAVGLFLPCRLQYDVQGVEQEMWVDLTAQLLHPAALHAVLQLQSLGLLLVQSLFHLVFLPQGVHLLGHGVLHVVEGVRQLAHLVLPRHRDVRGLQLPPDDGPRCPDHLLHRGQQPHEGPCHHQTQHKAQPHHHRLGPLDPAAEGRHRGVGALCVGDGGVQQLLGVLPQIAAAGRDFFVVELGRRSVLPGGDLSPQLLHKGGVAVIGGADGTVQQVLLLTHRVQAAVDAPQPRIGNGKGTVQLCQQCIGVAVLPAVVIQRCKAALHPVLKATDGVEVAHLVVQFPQHRAGLVKAQNDLSRQRGKKCRQTQHHPLLQRTLSMQDFFPPRPVFCPIDVLILPRFGPFVQDFPCLPEKNMVL